MTLSIGIKLEHPRAHGISPIILISDSRYTMDNNNYSDDGKKIWQLEKNIAVAFSGDVGLGESAISTLKEQLQLTESGTLDYLKKILKSSFDSVINPGYEQNPHCILGIVPKNWHSILLYARPLNTEYEIVEKSKVCIGQESLEKELIIKINEPPNGPGLMSLDSFMVWPDEVYINDEQRIQQAIHDAHQISSYIAFRFYELVSDDNKKYVNPPIQNVVITPAGCKELIMFDIENKNNIKKVSAGLDEVYGARVERAGPK